MSEIITAQAAEIIEQTRAYLSNPILSLEISTEPEKQNAVIFGNELQKKSTEIKNLKTQERKPYVNSLAACDDEFNATIALIKEKQTALSDAIGAYSVKVRQEEARLLKEAEKEAEDEVKTLESAAASAQERAEFWKGREDKLTKELATTDPADISPKLSRAYAIAVRYAKYWQEKANVKIEEKEEVEMAPVVAAAPSTGTLTATKGQRVTKKYGVQVTDLRALIAWAVKNNELYVIIPDMSRLTAIAKSSEGKRVVDGVKFTVTESFGFSGR